MIEKMIRLTPDQMAYQDRGKMKWQGLLLSDHSEALNKTKLVQEETNPLTLTKISTIEVSKILSIAYQNKHPVYFQTYTLTKDHHFQDFKAIVAGSQDNKIYFLLKNERLINVSLENIRSIVLLNPLIWQQSD